MSSLVQCGQRVATIETSSVIAHGVNTRSLEFRTTPDVRESLAYDVERIRAFPLLPESLEVGGAVYDVRTGRLETIDC